MLHLLKKQKNKGFTLLEVLLSIALIAVLMGIGTPIYQSVQNRNDLDISANTAAQSFRRAQLLSQAVDDDVVWGVYIGTGQTVIFKGATYASRETGFDEVFETSDTITPSGTTEVTFAKMTGEPSTTGTLTLTSNNNEARNVTINEKGMVEF